MAQKTTVRFIDDLDGSAASGTFDFSLEGRNYQIDLSDENAGKLRDALSPDPPTKSQVIVFLNGDRFGWVWACGIGR